MSTSDSHSHANHCDSGFVKEKMSTAGTRPVLRIDSPVRMCHPVSESVRSQLTSVVHQNNTTIGIRKAKSDSDGTGQCRAAKETVADSIDCSCSSVRVSGIVSSLGEDTQPQTKLLPAGRLVLQSAERSPCPRSRPSARTAPRKNCPVRSFAVVSAER